MSQRNRGFLLGVVAGLGLATLAMAQNDVPTAFTNQGGISNTRHNMMQSTESTNNGLTMNSFRNSYGEVCVYCHTPHGANTAAAAPLWNRLLSTGTVYTTYDQLNTSTLTQTVAQPGAASLPCLSCHDGSQAIDAIINMPGSGQYSPAAQPWTYAMPIAAVPPGGARKSSQHQGLGVSYDNSGATIANGSCMSCHAPDGGSFGIGFGVATSFAVFNIGTDLKNDHPVGVNFPVTNGPGTDWKAPTGSVTRGAVVTTFFDENTNGRMDKGDIRLYGSGSDSRVECASCHDPHGVPSAGAGSVFLPTFLRKTNAASAVCLTCHSK
jgi:hypothetical protein